MSTNEKGTPQSRTYTVNDIAAILGIGRATAYKLANSGLFKTIRIGNMIRISRKSLVVSRVMRKFDLALAEIYFRGRVHAPWLPSSGQGAKGQGRRYAARLALDAL